MKLRYYLLLLPLLFTAPACDEEGNLDFNCVLDVAVVSLDLINAVIPTSGGVASIKCTLGNMISAARECGSTGEIPMRITCAFSREPHRDFDDYTVYDVAQGRGASLEPGQVRDDPIMEMPLNQGPGYYAVRVETLNPDDAEPENNAMAVAFQVNP